MANKNVKTRVSNKYDMASNWEKATFIPMQGEFIIYAKEDVDENGEIYERFAQEQIKMGDGIHTVSELPFIDTKPFYNKYDAVPENAIIGSFKAVRSTDAPVQLTGSNINIEYNHNISFHLSQENTEYLDEGYNISFDLITYYGDPYFNNLDHPSWEEISFIFDDGPITVEVDHYHTWWDEDTQSGDTEHHYSTSTIEAHFIDEDDGWGIIIFDEVYDLDFIANLNDIVTEVIE